MSIGEHVELERYKARLFKKTSNNSPFWAACNDQRYMLQKCKTCGKFNNYPRQLCRHCTSADLQWLDIEGSGEIYSFTHARVSFYGNFWKSELPYTTAIIDLEEGVRILSRIIGEDHMSTAIGDRVELAWAIDAESDQKLPFFRRTSPLHRARVA